MCGRLNIYDPDLISEILLEMSLPAYPDHSPRYNVCPQESLPVLTPNKSFQNMEWGIEFGNFRHPNTRVSTLQRRPDLKQLLAQNRCLIPANRFYEWPDAKARPKYAGIKTRFCIHPENDFILFGGFFKPVDENHAQFNILTTGPTPAINDFHHRSPVMIPAQHAHHWLDQDLDTLFQYMQPSSDPLTIYECDPYVNNGRNKGAQAMAPLGNG